MKVKQPGKYGLTSTQAHCLDLLLKGRSHAAIQEEMGVSKQRVTELLEMLRTHGLIQSELDVEWKSKMLVAEEPAKAVTWYSEKRGVWAVVSMPVPRHERSDLVTNTHVVLIVSPVGDRAVVPVSNRDRLSYVEFEQVLARTDLHWVKEIPVVEREMLLAVAQAVGVEAVLPAWCAAGQSEETQDAE